MTKLELARKALFLLESGYHRYCCLAIDGAASLPSYSGFASLAAQAKEDFGRFYEEYWLPDGGYPFWGASVDQATQEDRINCVRWWIATLEEREQEAQE